MELFLVSLNGKSDATVKKRRRKAKDDDNEENMEDEEEDDENAVEEAMDTVPEKTVITDDDGIFTVMISFINIYSFTSKHILILQCAVFRSHLVLHPHQIKLSQVTELL